MDAGATAYMVDKDVSLSAKGKEQVITDRTAMGRWGQPQDLSGTAVFLASQASDFVTGTFIPVDGGYSVALN